MASFMGLKSSLLPAERKVPIPQRLPLFWMRGRAFLPTVWIFFSFFCFISSPTRTCLDRALDKQSIEDSHSTVAADAAKARIAAAFKDHADDARLSFDELVSKVSRCAPISLLADFTPILSIGKEGRRCPLVF